MSLKVGVHICMRGEVDEVLVELELELMGEVDATSFHLIVRGLDQIAVLRHVLRACASITDVSDVVWQIRVRRRCMLRRRSITC